jgi:flagellar biosynthesis/type III secretory pathway M-ring protein FliF/YscJ
MQRLKDWWAKWGTRSKVMIVMAAVMIPLFIIALIVIFGVFGGPLNIITAK